MKRTYYVIVNADGRIVETLRTVGAACTVAAVLDRWEPFTGPHRVRETVLIETRNAA